MATKSKYVRVFKKQQDTTFEEFEIRLSARRKISNYVVRAAVLLLDAQKPLDFVIFKATGNAIQNALVASEVVCRRIKGLHKISSIGSIEVVDEFKATEEGLDDLKISRNISLLSIKLTKNPSEEDRLAPGYQQPLDDKEIQEFTLDQIKDFQTKRRSSRFQRDFDDDERRDRDGGHRRRGGRGRGRGGNRRGDDRDRRRRSSSFSDEDRQQRRRRRDNDGYRRDRDDRDRRDDRQRKYSNNNRKYSRDEREDRRRKRSENRDRPQKGERKEQQRNDK